MEHRGLGGEIHRKPNRSARQRAKRWFETVKNLRMPGANFLRTHPNEDLETALKTLEVAQGSLEEVAEHYE